MSERCSSCLHADAVRLAATLAGRGAEDSDERIASRKMERLIGIIQDLENFTGLAPWALERHVQECRDGAGWVHECLERAEEEADGGLDRKDKWTVVRQAFNLWKAWVFHNGG